jgi:hypothetical protein
MGFPLNVEKAGIVEALNSGKHIEHHQRLQTTACWKRCKTIIKNPESQVHALTYFLTSIMIFAFRKWVFH